MCVCSSLDWFHFWCACLRRATGGMRGEPGIGLSCLAGPHCCPHRLQWTDVVLHLCGCARVYVCVCVWCFTCMPIYIFLYILLLLFLCSPLSRASTRPSARLPAAANTATASPLDPCALKNSLWRPLAASGGEITRVPQREWALSWGLEQARAGSSTPAQGGTHAYAHARAHK